MPQRYRPAVLVHARIFVVDAEVVEKGDDLHGKGFIELKQADVGDGQASLA